MKLKETIEKDIKRLLHEKDKETLRVLRNLKSLILLTEEKQSGKVLSQKKEKAILLQAIEQRRQAINIYNSQGRPELARKEEEEASIIEQYLPLTYNKNDLREIIFKTMQENQVADTEGIQHILPIISEKLAHKTDQNFILAVAKELITQK